MVTFQNHCSLMIAHTILSLACIHTPVQVRHLVYLQLCHHLAVDPLVHLLVNGVPTTRDKGWKIYLKKNVLILCKGDLFHL